MTRTLRSMRPMLPVLAFNAALVAATAFHAPLSVMIPIWLVGGVLCVRAWRATPMGFERRWLVSCVAVALGGVALLESKIVPGRPLRLTLAWLVFAALVAIPAPSFVLLVKELARARRTIVEARAFLKRLRNAEGTRPPGQVT